MRRRTIFLGRAMMAGLGLALLLSGCGGKLVEDDGSVSEESNGGANATGTSVSYCFGQEDTTPADFCVGMTMQKGPLEEGSSCSINVPIGEGLHLNPDYLRIYFDLDGGRWEIPYVGTSSDICPATGGWYATNITTSGSTDVGLCECSCLAAQVHEITLVVECDGLPNS